MTSQISEESKVPTLDRLTIDQLQFYLDKARPIVESFAKMEGLARETRLAAEQKITDFAIAMKMNRVDQDALEAFFTKPYPRLEQARDQKGRLVPETWKLTIPRFIPIQIGFLESQDEAWNYFRVNRYMDWFGEIPDFIKKQIGWKDAPELKIEGEELVGSKEELAKAIKRYPGMLKEQDGKVMINKDRAYDLIVGLLKEGVKPFMKNPVDPEDLVEKRFDFELRPYQKDIWNAFKERRSIGVFIPPSTGKTVIATYIATHIKGPTLVVVPTNTLVEQWQDFIETNTDLKLGSDIEVCTYQSAIKRKSDREWMLVIFDEVHHQPAHEFIKLSLLKRKYSIGLSASPYREDEGGEELIFALTGFPVGLAWQYFKELKIIKSPVCNVWIEKNLDSKLKRLTTMLQEPKKTIIFSDSLEFGKSVAGRFGIPFVYGASVERLQTLRNNQTIVVSRVGDEGVSLPDIERVIEISWLFGSRRQEIQRFTRLLHGQTQSEGEAHILMTLEEYAHDKKRLFSVMEKGFKIVLHKEGMDERVVQRAERSAEKKPSKTLREPRQAGSEAKPQPSQPDTSEIDAIYQKVGLQRAPKFRANMNKAQQKVFDYLIQNDGNFYTKEKLALLLEYSSMDSLRVSADFPEMVRKGWIEERKDGKLSAYGTSMRSKVA